MESNLIGLIAIAIAIFLGLIGIGGLTFSGLRGFRVQLSGQLSDVGGKVASIQQTVNEVWDVIKRSHLFASGGTVRKQLNNLGAIEITAEPRVNYTEYFIESKDFVRLDIELIEKLSKETDLEDIEKKMFDGKVPELYSLLSHQMKIRLASTDAKLCTEYMNIFLKWLDSKYFELLPKPRDFEKSIEF